MMPERPSTTEEADRDGTASTGASTYEEAKAMATHDTPEERDEKAEILRAEREAVAKAVRRDLRRFVWETRFYIALLFGICMFVLLSGKL